MEKKAKKKVAVKVEKERTEFKELIIKNPNYFGTVPQVKMKPILAMSCNKKYEELKCVGFYPEQDLLEAVFDVKLPYGYSGGLCSHGSYEYVRFFVDWDGDGKFDKPDEDVGIVCVNVHDIPNVETPCLKGTKPLSYAVTVKINPKRFYCINPQLVKVRAILSWNKPPTPGDPDFHPPWGNIVNEWIQIKPTKPFEIKLKDIFDEAILKKLKIKSTMLDLDAAVGKIETVTLAELKEIYKDKVPEHRFDFPQMHQIVEKIKQDPGLIEKYKLDPELSEMIATVNAVFNLAEDTTYEELTCVGLNYDMDTLMATLTVKLPYGYSGNLCAHGSYEYVAFWAYMWDQIEQMCYWKYLGTTKINVHDIPKIPREGLQYAAYLSVDFSKLRDRCTRPKVLMVRAILSWEKSPPTNDPDFKPPWGNKINALIQIKPGEPTQPGQQKPFIWSAGGMAVESISGNMYTNQFSSIGEGYANGPSIYGGYNAKESPFGGIIAISGSITNPPNNPSEDQKLRYKMQYRRVGEAIWHDITNWFRIWIRKDGVPSGYVDQTADADGYFKYQKDLEKPVICEVEGDVLAQWYTPVSDGDGLYEIRMLLKDQNAPQEPGVPLGNKSSNTVRIRIDNTPPVAEISLDAGACEQFKPGNVITGKFKATDDHIWKYGFSMWPYPKTISHIPAQDTYPMLSPPGVTSGTFSIDTTNMTPCGYVIYLEVLDRTIRNNSLSGNRNAASVGLCLLKA